MDAGQALGDVLEGLMMQDIAEFPVIGKLEKRPAIVGVGINLALRAHDDETLEIPLSVKSRDVVESRRPGPMLHPMDLHRSLARIEMVRDLPPRPISLISQP